jgi:spore germination protein YaaH
MPLIAATLLAVGGWIVPWQHDAGLAAVERARGGLGDVFLFAVRLDADGHPVLDGSAEAWAGTIRRVHDRGARAWLTVVNDLVSAGTSATLKDADIVHRLIADADARAAHSREIVALAKSLSVDGLDLDYENLPASERDAFTAFVGRLAADLHASDLSLSVTVQPKRRETSSKGPGAADWRRICAVADRMQVMLYNQHNAATGAGPIADLDWIGGIVDYGLDTCPASKLVPVVKVSGMDWGPAKAEWRSFAEVSSTRAALRPRLRREHVSRVPWFSYHGDDGRHVVYFEDAASLGAKAERLRARGLSTIVLWSLGSEDPEAIPQLVQTFRPAAGQKR